VARTLRFSLSLNPARSPRIARYLAPAWWYGACAEVTPRPYLPVRNEFDEVVEGALRYPAAHIVQGGFEDGCLPRAARQAGEERHETSWEGELPAAMLVQSWLRQHADEHARALRACYFFTDIAVDHAMRLVRMHGYLPPAVSLPMQRVHACVLGWLETGDPYLGETARAVVANAYLLHKNSWPRLATGRDACSIRGAILLYRYTGDRHYLTLGRDMIADVIATQQPDGSFRDQGGGTGIHGWGAYITKPWMCCMAVGGMLDYLDLVPEDEAVAASVLRLADWLLAERWFHHGVRGWSYKHFCKGGRRQYSPREGGELKLPTPDLWHSDYLARILPWASERTGNPAYFDAFMESFNAKSERERRGDHAVAQSLQFLPWLQARLWRVELGAKGLTMAPAHYGERTPASGSLLTPEGEVTLRWTATGKLVTTPTGKLRRRAQP
jgi:hypothetical protein